MEEVERNLHTTFNRTAEQVARRVNNMQHHFPDVQVTGYESLIGMMGNDPKDRHVLAAAVRANADMIVTYNLSRTSPKKPYPLTTLVWPILISFCAISSI